MVARMMFVASRRANSPSSPSPRARRPAKHTNQDNDRFGPNARICLCRDPRGYRITCVEKAEEFGSAGGEGREAGRGPIIDLVAGVVDQRNETVKEVLEAKGPSPGDFDPGVEVARHPSVAVPGGVKCRARAFAGAPTDR
jgi:hypothetical protein